MTRLDDLRAKYADEQNHVGTNRDAELEAVLRVANQMFDVQTAYERLQERRRNREALAYYTPVDGFPRYFPIEYQPWIGAVTVI